MAMAVEATADLASVPPGAVPQSQQPLQPREASTVAGSQAAADKSTLVRRLLKLHHFQPDLASTTISALTTAHQCSRLREEREIPPPSALAALLGPQYHSVQPCSTTPQHAPPSGSRACQQRLVQRSAAQGCFGPDQQHVGQPQGRLGASSRASSALSSAVAFCDDAKQRCHLVTGHGGAGVFRAGL